MRVGLISLLALMVFSCEYSDGWYGIRRIVNETEHGLEVEVLAEGRWYRFEVPAQSVLTLEGGCQVVRADKECELGWPGRTDSASVIFDGDRFIPFGPPLYHLCEERNIASDPYFECHGYEAMEIGGDTIQYTYRITEADYQSAQPIGE